MAFFVRNLQIRCPASATTKASPPLHRSDSLPSAPRSKLSGTADEGVRRRPGTHYFNLPRPFSLAKAKPEPHHRLHHQNLSRSATEKEKKNQKTKIEKCTCRAFAAQPTSPSSEPAPFPFPLPRQPSLLFRVNPAAPPLATAPWRPAELPGAPRRLPRGPPARPRQARLRTILLTGRTPEGQRLLLLLRGLQPSIGKRLRRRWHRPPNKDSPGKPSQN